MKMSGAEIEHVLILGFIGILVISFFFAKRAPILVVTLIAILVTWQHRSFAPLAFAHNSDFQPWRVDVLDIGHGLAVLIERNGESILYDTGGAWRSGSMAQSVVDPILKQRGSELVGLILSHSDRDHAGGASWVLEHVQPTWLRSVDVINQNFQYPLGQTEHLPCVQGKDWQWQNLNFEVLFPSRQFDDPENKDSCVIRVSDGKHSILLTGDLPKRQERALVRKGADLSSDIMLVPHHGSKTSSSVDFLQTVSPQAAIVSAGRYTPWQLPALQIIQRYKDQNIDWYDTAKLGQISVHFTAEDWQILSQRFDKEPYWYRKMFVAL